MDLIPSNEQQPIIGTLQDFLNTEAPVSRVRDHGAIGNPDAALWGKLGELGFLGLSLSEEQGGVGLSTAEEFLVYREFGRYLISPVVLGLSLAARMASYAGNSSLRDRLLSGSVQVGIANGFPDLRSGAQLSGEVHLFDAKTADWVLFADELGGALISTASLASRRQVDAMDAVIPLERAILHDVKPEIWIDAEDDPIYRRALLLLAAYATGMSEATRDMAVEYAKLREQFGKPIGSFQAIKHLCAEMAIRSESALALTSFAALVMAEHREDADFQVVSSKIVATDSALKNSADNIQVHGAFGFTAEADAHHFLKRAHVVDHLFGGLRQQRQRLLDLPPAAA